jgi:hypothetical protein
MPSNASPLTIEQVTGPRRLMIFKGRGLPYQPIELGVEIRTKQTWLPANPVATQQVLGSMLSNTVLTGMWKDRFLLSNTASNGVDLVGFPQVSGAGIPQSGVASGGTFITTAVFPSSQPAQLARVVVDALTLMATDQQKVRVTWDQYVRYGLIKRFTPRFLRISDVEFELEFEWSGVTEFSPVRRFVEFNALTVAAGLAAILATILAVIDVLLSLRQPNAFIRRVVTAITTIGDLIVGIIEALRGIVSIASVPQDLLSTVRGQLALIRLAARGLLQDFAEIRSARGDASLVGSPSATANAALIESLLRERLQELAAFAAEQQRLLELFEGTEILSTFLADTLTSLRDVASENYGDPTQWTVISNYNGFYSDTVPRGTLVRVPAIN